MRTWRVFAEPVTYITAILPTEIRSNQRLFLGIYTFSIDLSIRCVQSVVNLIMECRKAYKAQVW